MIGLLVSSVAYADKSELKQLPTENLDFEIIDRHLATILSKDQFETTDEFEKRKKEKESLKKLNIFVKKSLSYDADSETYSFSCFTTESIELKDDTYYVSRIGQNSFGAKWQWEEKTGKKYTLSYPCPNKKISKIEIPLEDARNYRNELVAVLQIELEPQNWDYTRKFETPKLGDLFVDNYEISSKKGKIVAVHYGLETNREIYLSKFVDTENNDLTTNKPIVRIEPKYPSSAARDNIEGWVELRFTINEVGGVEDVNVINANPKRVFDRAAKKALKKWKYKPNIDGGRPQKQLNQKVRLYFKSEKYKRALSLIKDTIYRNLEPNKVFLGKKCSIKIRLGIGGVVLGVQRVSGDDALCRATEIAIYKPTNLPVPRDPKVLSQLKDIKLTIEQ